MNPKIQSYRVAYIETKPVADENKKVTCPMDHTRGLWRLENYANHLCVFIDSGLVGRPKGLSAIGIFS